MTARASPSILPKGFFWFLSCFQREAQELKGFKWFKEFKWFKGSRVLLRLIRLSSQQIQDFPW